MLLYILFSFLLIVSLIFVNGNRKTQLSVVLFFSFVVFVLTGTRWEYGGDWDNYYLYFNESAKFKLDELVFEPGYSILSFCVKNIFDSFVVLQFCMAGIIFYTINKSIKALSLVPILSYMVFFAMENGGLNYVRTTVATCIIIYSYTYVVKGELRHFLITVLLAMSIHFSAFVAFPLYWAYHNKVSYKKYIIIGLVCVGVFYVIGKTFLSGFSLFGSYVEAKLDRYIAAGATEENFGNTWSIEAALINHVVKKGALFLFIFLFCRKALKNDSVFRGLTNIYIIATIYYCSVVPITIQFARTSGYMDGVEIFLYGFVYKYIPRKKWKLVFLLVAIVMNIIRIRGHIDVNNPLIYNYHNVLFY